MNNTFETYQQKKNEINDCIKHEINLLSFDEAVLFYEKLLSRSVEDAFIVGLEILDKKEDGKYVTSFSDSFGCMLWADGNYNMLPYLIEKMENNDEQKDSFMDYIRSLILGCSQTRKPIQDETELDLEVERLIKLYRF